MAAKGICSAAFVVGRPAKELFAEDVLPASPVLAAISLSVDEADHSVTARFAGAVSRRAMLVWDRGCVLDVEAGPGVPAYKPSVDGTKPWPEGEAAVLTAQWGPGVDAAKLQQVLDSAFTGAGDPLAANARGVAVVHKGRRCSGCVPGGPGAGLGGRLAQRCTQEHQGVGSALYA